MNEKGEIIKQIYKIYSEIKDTIENRLNEFKKNYEKYGNDELFAEFSFCILTPQSKAKLCWKAIEILKNNKLLYYGDVDEIIEHLYGVRFKYKKAKYIVENRDFFTGFSDFNNNGNSNNEYDKVYNYKNSNGYNDKDINKYSDKMNKKNNIKIKEYIESLYKKYSNNFSNNNKNIHNNNHNNNYNNKNCNNRNKNNNKNNNYNKSKKNQNNNYNNNFYYHNINFEVRNHLAKNIKGYGLKEASHFLRNIGKGDGIAILDRHILKNMFYANVIDEIPSSISKKLYFELEQKFLEFADRLNIDSQHLDFILWYKEANDVFK